MIVVSHHDIRIQYFIFYMQELHIWTTVFVFILFFRYSSVLWTKYGVLKADTTLVFVNSSGALMSIIYIIIFYIFTSSRVWITTWFMSYILMWNLLSIIRQHRIILCCNLPSISVVHVCIVSQIALKFGSHWSTPSSSNFAPNSTTPVDFSVGDILWQIAAEWLETVQWPPMFPLIIFWSERSKWTSA